MRNQNLSMTWYQKNKARSSASTGARISTGKFSPTSPKGGFGTNVYEGVRYLDERYGSGYERYYRQRLFGKNPDDYRWRYDVNKRLIGRPDYKGRVSFPWLPRWQKKKYQTSYSKFQKSSVFRRRKFQSRFYKRSNSCRSRFNRCWTDRSYRYSSSYRKYY